MSPIQKPSQSCGPQAHVICLGADFDEGKKKKRKEKTGYQIEIDWKSTFSGKGARYGRNQTWVE